MALKDFVALADDKLHEVFTRKQHDPQPHRAAMLKRLDTAQAQFAAKSPTRGRKMWKLNNGVVELTLPFAIAGKSVFHIPSERFADAITHLKEAIGMGEADDDLKSHAQGGSASKTTARAPRKPRDPNADGSRSWSPERRAKFAETIAARKKADS